MYIYRKKTDLKRVYRIYTYIIYYLSSVSTVTMLYITMQHKTVYGVQIAALDNEVSYK